MASRIGGPDMALAALALLAQRAGQGKGRSVATKAWDTQPGTRSMCARTCL